MYARKNVSMKVVTLVLAAVLLFGCAVGGTLAWLMDTTNTVTNTFTVGDVNIDLKETVNGTEQSAATDAVTNEGFKIVPGTSQTKDPKVVVEAGSETSWVFVKVEESNIVVNGVTYVSYTVDGGWTALPDVSGVYYREYKADAEATYPILTDNKVSYSADLTKAQLDALGDSKPSLVFKAYAIQKVNGDGTTFTPKAAWEELNK